MTLGYRRSLVALAVAASSTAAYAQSPCDQEISRIEQEIQQQQLNQQRQMEVRDLLQAARERTGDCTTYVARARQLLDQGVQTEPTRTAERAVPTQVEPDPQVRQPVQPEHPVAQQQPQRQSAGPDDDTLDIQVDQAPAEVDVQTRSPQIVVKQQPTEVTVEQKPPQVEITQSKPKISVEQPKPEVQVNRAQPDVEVTQSEPQVEVRQSDPNVRVVQPEATARVETEQAGQQAVGQTAQQTGQTLQDVQGNQALSSQGEEIGEVQDFVRSTTDGSAYALVSVGGVLGVGDRTIAVPLDQAQLTRDGNLQTQLTMDEIEQQQEYDQQQFEEIRQSEFAALEAQLESQQ